MIVFYILDHPPYRSDFLPLFSFEIASSRLNYFIPSGFTGNKGGTQGPPGPKVTVNIFLNLNKSDHDNFSVKSYISILFWY